jgi:hypothetical protein
LFEQGSETLEQVVFERLKRVGGDDTQRRHQLFPTLASPSNR